MDTARKCTFPPSIQTQDNWEANILRLPWIRNLTTNRAWKYAERCNARDGDAAGSRQQSIPRLTTTRPQSDLTSSSGSSKLPTHIVESNDSDDNYTEGYLSWAESDDDSINIKGNISVLYFTILLCCL
jgi:hypothetical protein